MFRPEPIPPRNKRGVNYIVGTIYNITCHLILPSIAILVFTSFVMQAVYAANDETVFNACGNYLWNYMVTRLILSFLGLLLLYVITRCGVYLWQEWDGMKLFGILVLIYHITLVGVGAKVTTTAMQNTNCTSALSYVSFSHTPLLAELGYVYLSLDCIWLLLVVVGCCMFCCIEM